MRWPWLDICMRSINCCKLWNMQPVLSTSLEQRWPASSYLWPALVTLLSGNSGWWASSNSGNGGKSLLSVWLQMLPHSFCPNFYWPFTTEKWRIYSEPTGKNRKRAVLPSTKSGGIKYFSFWHEYNMICLMVVIQTSGKWKVKSNSF